jgi:hypothetical protein
MSTSPTICESCGGSIVQPPSARHPDFCSRECLRAGRAFCRQCGESLPRGFNRAFCSNLCSRKYYRRKINPNYRDEVNRTTCKNCGSPITQSKTGKRMFCNSKCNYAYLRASEHGYSLDDEWGGYAPETRRILLELQSLKLNGTAQRLALAIDREYKIRNRKLHAQPHITICHCKTCGKEFRRKTKSMRSRDYCSFKCYPKYGRQVTLTWEQVDEIRSLYATGQFSQKTLAEKFGVSQSAISSIIVYQSWIPENDPMRLGKNHVIARGRTGEKSWAAKLTWEQVDEIRNIRATKHLSYKKIGEMYGVTDGTIRPIVKYQTWKPENDPRRKRDSA